MSLEAPADGESAADAGETVSAPLADREVSLDVPDAATPREAAAIVAAVGAHLNDRQRAAAAAAQGSDGPEYADQWTLAGRLNAVGKRRRPRDVEKGDEWKAAARSFY